MKSHITIILDEDTKEILSGLKKALAPHWLDPDSIESMKNHHWDYWYFPDGFPVEKNELRIDFPNEDAEVLANTCYINTLPDNYTTSGIIDTNGNWNDLQDHGWKLVNGSGLANQRAMKKWKIKMKQILNENKDKICVQVVLHC